MQTGIFSREEFKKRTALRRDAEIGTVEALCRNIQLIADLSYADILVYVLAKGGEGFVVVAEAKPNTSISVHARSQLGGKKSDLPQAEAVVQRAFEKGRRERLASGVLGRRPVAVEAVPIRNGEQIIAVMTRERRGDRAGRLSEMELTYMWAADELVRMIEDGLVDIGLSFPSSKEAGDGLLRIDSDGIITYASPNAVTIYKRLGVEQDIVGQHFAGLGLDESPVAEALEGHRAEEREIADRGMSVVKRAIPLVESGQVKGVISIVRDMTDLRAREQQLKLKEATIREIHHRVKNNLQTIASLLRLQARRLNLDEAREALLESVGRISSIAAVHETLSQQTVGSLDFREVLGSIAAMVEQGLANPETKVTIEMVGEGGQVPTPAATSLALVATELLQNAVRHAFVGRKNGRIRVELSRDEEALTLRVVDDGIGLPKGFNPKEHSNLGLEIVNTLVSQELKGEWYISGNEGTEVEIRVPAQSLAREDEGS